MKGLNFWLSGAVAVALIAGAGAQWDETANGGGDAGDLPSTAQITVGVGALTQIIGNATSANDADMYCIKIVDPLNFSATTVGGATWDTQLTLFRLDGTGLLYNDDDPQSGTLQSYLGNAIPVNPGNITWSTWASANLSPGDYLLAVSRWNNDPINSDNPTFLSFRHSATA